jgi:uncharacterized protein YxeA
MLALLGSASLLKSWLRDTKPALIIIIIILLLLLLLLFTAIEFSLGGSNPYTSTDKTNKNKYT